MKEELEEVKRVLPELNSLFNKRFGNDSPIPRFWVKENPEKDTWDLYFKDISFYSNRGIEEHMAKGINNRHTKAEKLAIIFNNTMEYLKIKI